jgi:purine-nucleoside phosphorylase
MREKCFSVSSQACRYGDARALSLLRRLDDEAITYPVRVMKPMGIKAFPFQRCRNLNRNSAWRHNVITDHLNMIGDNPLIGATTMNLRAFSRHFRLLYNRMRNVVARRHWSFQCDCTERLRALAGPNLETAAEYRFFARNWADAVGMSPSSRGDSLRFMRV